MWADDSADGAGFRPLLGPDGRRVGFGAWYRGWLERAERPADPAVLGPRAVGGDPAS